MIETWIDSSQPDNRLLFTGNISKEYLIKNKRWFSCSKGHLGWNGSVDRIKWFNYLKGWYFLRIMIKFNLRDKCHSKLWTGKNDIHKNKKTYLYICTKYTHTYTNMHLHIFTDAHTKKYISYSYIRYIIGHK